MERRNLPSRRTAGFVFTLGLVWLAWGTPLAAPLRTLTTFLHEMGHAAAAVVTGGSLDRITIEADGSGLCYTSGGWRWFTLMGGYLGSMFFGSLILILAMRAHKDKVISFVLGAGLVLVCFLYVPFRNFGFWSGVVMGTALASSGWWLSEDVNDLVLTFIGAATCLHAIFDIRTLLVIGDGGRTDASMFAREVFPLPAAVWAVFWGVLALIWLFFALRYALSERRDFFRD